MHYSVINSVIKLSSNLKRRERIPTDSKSMKYNYFLKTVICNDCFIQCEVFLVFLT